MQNEAKIQLENVDGKLKITTTFPVWVEKVDEKRYDIHIALLGIETYALGEEQIDTSIKEAVEIFFKAAEKYGKGIKEELNILSPKGDRFDNIG